jgi:hypothetical protein
MPQLAVCGKNVAVVVERRKNNHHESSVCLIIWQASFFLMILLNWAFYKGQMNLALGHTHISNNVLPEMLKPLHLHYLEIKLVLKNS